VASPSCRKTIATISSSIISGTPWIGLSTISRCQTSQLIIAISPKMTSVPTALSPESAQRSTVSAPTLEANTPVSPSPAGGTGGLSDIVGRRPGYLSQSRAIGCLAARISAI
jgi:hypothetical protein